MKKVFYWLPRILSVLFIAFISVFALDSFDSPNWPLALFMHLIPSYILIMVTIIAWKKEKIGGILFLTTGLFLLIFTHFSSIILSVPAFIIGLLFLSKNYLSKT